MAHRHDPEIAAASLDASSGRLSVARETRTVTLADAKGATRTQNVWRISLDGEYAPGPTRKGPPYERLRSFVDAARGSRPADMHVTFPDGPGSPAAVALALDTTDAARPTLEAALKTLDPAATLRVTAGPSGTLRATSDAKVALEAR